MRKRESARRNILLLISVFVAATALIVLVPFLRPSIPSAPPEPPELSAKRFAPENAFQTLIEAAKLIPTQQRESAFAQARASMLDQCRQDPLARLLHSPFPEEDTVEFLRMPALAKMRQALAKPYFLLPIAWKEDAGNWRTLARVPRRRRSNEPPSDNGLFSKEFEQISRLARISSHAAMRAKLSYGSDSVVLSHVLCSLQLALRIAEDGDSLNPSVGILKDAVLALPEIVRDIPDNELRDFAARVASFSVSIPPMSANVECLLRRFENVNAFGEQDRDDGPPRILRRVFFSVGMRKFRQWLSTERAELIHAATLPYDEFISCTFQRRASRLRSHDMFAAWLLSASEELAKSRATMEVWLAGANAIVALERFRQKNGAFPDSLDALVPEYLATVPSDAFKKNNPLTYSNSGSCYHLYSVGENRIDNGGITVINGNAFPQADDIVIRWALPQSEPDSLPRATF